MFTANGTLVVKITLGALQGRTAMTEYGSIAETHFEITLLGRADRHIWIALKFSGEIASCCAEPRHIPCDHAGPQLPHRECAKIQVRLQHHTIRLFVGCPGRWVEQPLQSSTVSVKNSSEAEKQTKANPGQLSEGRLKILSVVATLRNYPEETMSRDIQLLAWIRSQLLPTH